MTSWSRLIAEVKSGNIIIASDGSVAGSIGTFGWVIAVKTTGERLLENSGWTRGGDPSSYRSEIYGGLSASRLLLQFSRYFSVPLSDKLSWYCDNESLVKGYQEQKIEDDIHQCDLLEWENDEDELGEQVPLPAVLQADWDVLNTLFYTASEVKLEAIWVQSHQDKKKPIHELSLEAQLNC